MTHPEIVKVTYEDLRVWHGKFLADPPDDLLTHIALFGGDRLTAISNGGGFHAVADGVVGAVTYSPTGESGSPGIVGLWVRPDWRRRKTGFDVASALMASAIDEMLAICGPVKIRIDVINRDAISAVSDARLGDRTRHLDVRRHF